MPGSCFKTRGNRVGMPLARGLAPNKPLERAGMHRRGEDNGERAGRSAPRRYPYNKLSVQRVSGE